MRYLVRHGHAGDKHLWAGADDDRPLSSTGQREARGLVALLAGYSVDKIVSSPALRCAQTVQPLAEQRGLVVRTDVALSVDADLEPTLTPNTPPHSAAEPPAEEARHARTRRRLEPSRAPGKRAAAARPQLQRAAPGAARRPDGRADPVRVPAHTGLHPA